MLVCQVFFFEQKHAFHLYLHVDFRNGNKLLSNIPTEVIKRHFPKLMVALKHAYIPSAIFGDKYLQHIAKHILANKLFHAFFYPNYLLNYGRISLNQVDLIINSSEQLKLFPKTHYCKNSFPLEFYVMSQMFLTNCKCTLKEAEEINVVDYMDYLMHTSMHEDFSLLDDSRSRYFKVIEEGELFYLLMLDENLQLKMVISL
jgi:hypothetical protein